VYGPANGELVVTGVVAESVTTTFALSVLPIRFVLLTNMKELVEPAFIVLIIALVMEL